MITSQLKQHTAATHAALDEKMSAWLETSSRAGYLGLLRRLYGFYAPVEQALQEASPALAHALQLDRRRKTPLLSADIAALGGDASAADLPWCRQLPDLGADPRLLGGLYVLEGATLGGQIILRRIGPRLQVSAADGARFFASYGPEVGPLWRAFQATLITYTAEHPGADREMLDAAADTFARFDAWLFGKGR